MWLVPPGPVAEVDEADDSISDDEEPREEQIPSLPTAEGKTTTSPPPAVEPQKSQEESKPEPEKEAEPSKEKSDVPQEEEKPQGNVMTLSTYQMMVMKREFC